VINLKKGKTETILFGTTPKLKKAENLKLTYNGVGINVTTEYKYLGSIVDSKLSLNKNFNSVYKKASARLRLLSALRFQMDDLTTSRVYDTMVTPLITFNSIINLNLNLTQQSKLTSLDNRARAITNNAQLPSVRSKILRNACCIVRKSLDGNICSNFVNYFGKLNHTKSTRNNGNLLKLPRIKLELARNGFFYMGASIYNNLPLDVRQESSYMNFKKKLKVCEF